MAGKDKKITTSTKVRIQRNAIKKTKEEFLDLLSTLQPYPLKEKETNINEQLAEREKIKNDALVQDIALKRNTLFMLFGFLGIETLVIFGFALLQGTHWIQFHLEEWSFKLLIGATILQITYMLQVAVKHLFPNK